MTVMTSSNCVDQIGETAGMVWHHLREERQTSYSKLAKQLDLPRDVVMQAIGWLAREEKIHIEETSRGRVVSLV